MDTWQRIENWLSAHAPTVLEGLQPGATDLQLTDAERVLSVQFPADFRALYARHNGQVGGSPSLLPPGEFLSLENIIDQWTVWKDLVDSNTFDGIDSEPDPGIRNDWFNLRWIPFTHDGSGNHFCIDLDPAPGGAAGQVITMWHDSGERELIASSISEFFAKFAEDLDAGLFVYSEDYDAIVSVDDVDN